MFTLTVDTEADNQWDHGVPLRTDNVRYWEPFQAVCRKHGFSPTYLITSEISEDSLAQALLTRWAADGEAEVGAHLHPWTTPPFLDAPGFRFNDPSHAFISELPGELVQAKLENLTRQIQENLGVRPTAFRAGRFGLNLKCAQVLAELGYLVDSSVTPLTDWGPHEGLSGGAGGPNFAAHTARPFLIRGTGDNGLIEVPVTIVPTYGLLRRFPSLLRLYHALPGRGAPIILRRWLSPQPVWLHAAKRYYFRQELKRAYECQSEDSSVAVMMVHSSELMPGGSPSTPTEASVREILERLDRFLAFIASRGAISTTLSQAGVELRLLGSLDWHDL